MQIPKRSAAAAVALLTAIAFAACDQDVASPDGSVPDAAFVKTAGTGNGAPSGWHWTLLIHGVANNGQGIGNGNGMHNMWVRLWGNTKILLSEGDYGVIDADGRDGTASFSLPNPDEDGDGVTKYSVFARGLGQGSAKVALCADDPSSTDPADVICNTGSLEVTLGKNGKNTFRNVSKELLFLWDVDLDGDGVVDLNRIGLFDDALEDYFWSYDNSGLRLAQLRFYPCSTDVGATSGDPINDAACFS